MMRLIIFVMSLSLWCSVFADHYESIRWVDLLPDEDFKALTEDPIPSKVEEGSAADRINSALSMTIEDPVSNYEKALVSVRVREEYNQRAVKLPGYIVPVETTEEGRAVSFFFVPFFGACIHLPPPPPNQIIYATYPKGIRVEVLEDAYWIEAILTTEQQTNELATAAYSAKVEQLYPFKEGDEY